MRLLVILSCVIWIRGAALNGAEETRDSITINRVHYVKEVLKSGIDRPYFLAIDSATNTLYFSYTVNDTDFKTAKIELNGKKFVGLDIENGFSQTVDEKNHVVYFGTSKGINVHDIFDDTNNAAIILPDTDIWQVYFNEILYYSDFPDQNIYTFIDGVSKPFEDLKEMKISHFCIDRDGVIFYNNSTGLFSQKKGDENAVAYKELALGEDIRAIAADIHGDVFVCFEDGIYKVDKSKAALKKILNVDGAFGLAFDKNNHIVYSDSNSLVYLRPYSE